jgi:hypothetical protein
VTIDVQSLTTQQKLDLAGVFGQIVLSTGTFSSPTEFVDIVLPAGYKQFKLNMRGVQYDARDTMGIAVSVDGGATFICDTGNGDSYFEQGGVSEGSTFNNIHNTNALMDINQGVQGIGDNPPLDMIFDIFPGSATETFRLMYMTLCHHNINGIYSEFGAQGLNPAATVAPTPARVNALRILPFGNGDCQPPTSGEHITAGSWSLIGVA